MSDASKKDYKATLNLPQTSFPMKANLVQREPELLAFWERIDAYGRMCASGGEKGRFVLHDGPPYANGHIHLGTALNKILKDIIVKSRNMQGYTAGFVPGWDCHGLPIELKVEQEIKEKKKSLPAHTVRKICREYATKWLDVQRKEFIRLGVLGSWQDPYRSMAPDYEAATARELGNILAAGYAMRSKKPIHWCCSCKTALAEAEVEYYDHTSPSIYVRFPLVDTRLREVFPEFPETLAGRIFVVIWTTTPWTLPDNMAVAVHPDFDYVLVQAGEDCYVLAEERLEPCRAAFGWGEAVALCRVRGEQLAGLICEHPFYDRPSPIVTGRHVTLDAGTGAVHTAPGHGREDYETGLENGLDILSPLDDSGRFLDSVEFFAGKTVLEANPLVIDKLIEVDNLIAREDINHSYPHCWRCKQPVIFRATTQWFISMDAGELRKKTLEAIRNDVRWIPSWGEERIYSMIENRPDWCISRQRIWGVPIVALLCESCGNAWHDPAWNSEMAERFAAHPTGCDYWFEASIEEIAPAGLTCPSCGGTRWKRESDILDVWFDSGTSFAAVVERRPECAFPADLYLEGSDQHRGWFHSSLLASMATRKTPPYKAVLTHGYVVDGEGKKMSKSVGNVVAPEQVIAKYGAEILRMWVASVDYREDIRMSDEILNRQVDAYRRIRNTCRYLLGNLGDFTPEQALPDAELDPLDRYALHVVSGVHEEVQAAYHACEFHKVFHALHNLCVTDLSAFYLDVLKDRLYAFAPNSRERRSAQTALWRILLMLLADMAPVLSFTAEEALSHLAPSLRPEVATVFALQESQIHPLRLDEEESARWATLLTLRAELTRAIEPLRKAGGIGHALDTCVTLYASDGLAGDLTALATDLRALFIVSQLDIRPVGDAPADSLPAQDIPDLRISVAKAKGEKCARCWIYSTELGGDPASPVCPRCAAVLRELQA